jgi:hypothetical protein
MKKLVGLLVLLSILIACLCAGAVAEVKVDPSLYPVTPNGKDIIQNPTTYCNPITVSAGSNRMSGGGEPIVRVFQDDYYLTVSRQPGYWWSHDFVNWTYVAAPDMVTGIIGWVEIDGELYSYAGNGTSKIAKAIDVKAGKWEVVGQFSAYHNDGSPTGGYGDASMLYDEETGRLFMYYGWSQILGIRCVEIDKNTWQEIGEPVVCLWGDPHRHGWETRYVEDNIYTLRQLTREYRPEEYGWTEGGHPLKYNGKYYLMYASIGYEFYSYGHGVYVADDPMGPFHYLEDNPLTMKTTGIAPGAGHGAIWTDRLNNVWTICMIGNALDRQSGVTLRNLFPSGVDEDGVMYGIEEYGDFPQYLPEVVDDPFGHYTKWALLTLDKKVEVSSELENCYAAYAVDEDAKNYWCAKTGDPGEYITVDLGEVCDIRGIQIMWDRKDAVSSRDPLDKYFCYTVEASDDNEVWTLIIDKSNNPQQLWSDYIELPTPVYARYLKLTNVFTPDEGKFAVKGFRAFGNPDKATFTKVENVKVVRSEVDRRVANLLWDEVPGAEGYLVRYGIAPNKLYNSYIVYWDNYLHIRSLNVDPDYYFEVEAFSSGTPRYVENTFATRGRGAELDLNKAANQEAGTAASTTRIMTYETYGVDEVYVFDNITPGTYTLRHTFGVGIWGPVELTEKELIGTGDEPTIEALNLSQFGNAEDKWGQIDVRVYPGEESGRIEVTLNYDND